MFNKVAYTA